MPRPRRRAGSSSPRRSTRAMTRARAGSRSPRARARSRWTACCGTALHDITPQKRAEEELRASREELRELASHLTRVREEEREIDRARDPRRRRQHAQRRQVRARMAQERSARDDADLARHLEQMDQLVDAVILASTRIMHDLRPGILDEGIVAVARLAGTRVRSSALGMPCRSSRRTTTSRSDPDRRSSLFRVCQEALNNIAKHARCLARRRQPASPPTDELVLEVHRQRPWAWRRRRHGQARVTSACAACASARSSLGRRRRRREGDRAAARRSRCAFRSNRRPRTASSARRSHRDSRRSSPTITRSCARACARSCRAAGLREVVGEAANHGEVIQLLRRELVRRARARHRDARQERHRHAEAGEGRSGRSCRC